MRIFYHESTVISVLYGSVDISFCLFLRFDVALVVILLTSSKTYLELDLAVLEIALRGYQGQSVFLGLGIEPDDLPLVHEELSCAVRVKIEPVAVLVRADVDTDKVHLAVFYLAV